jgi:N-acetylglutamate synthase-like GNAT family acetyltransferase
MAELLELFDRDVRADCKRREPGYTIEHVGRIARGVGPGPSEHQNYIKYSELNTANADAEIAAQIAFYKGKGHAFSWYVYHHDEPKDLGARLSAQGFIAQEHPDDVLAIATDKAQALALAPDVEIRPLSSEAELQDFATVQSAVWPGDPTWIVNHMRASMQEDNPSSTMYLAYKGNQAVGTGRVSLLNKPTFAGLFGGSVIKEARGCGIYRALIATRAAHAAKHGVRYLFTEAGPMSQPILHKLGFSHMDYRTPYVWRP